MDPRLEVAGRMVRNGSAAADIGTDHGYLICRLVASGRCLRGFACDIAEAPLNSAVREIERQGLGGCIEAILTDGLNGLEGKGVSDFLILGMGGDLIGKIITAHPWTKSEGLRFILNPMTRAHRLRILLCREGFALEQEEAVRSGRFIYTVMKWAYKGRPHEACDLFAWTGLLLNRTDCESRGYLRLAAKQIKARADGLAASGKQPREAARYHDLCTQIVKSL